MHKIKFCIFLFSVCFKIFDSDRDGVLNRTEVTQLIESLKQLAADQYSDELDGANRSSFQVSDLLPADMDSVSLEPFLIWTVPRNSLQHLLNLLHQVKL